MKTFLYATGEGCSIASLLIFFMPNIMNNMHLTPMQYIFEYIDLCIIVFILFVIGLILITLGFIIPKKKERKGQD